MKPTQVSPLPSPLMGVSPQVLRWGPLMGSKDSIQELWGSLPLRCGPCLLGHPTPKLGGDLIYSFYSGIYILVTKNLTLFMFINSPIKPIRVIYRHYFQYHTLLPRFLSWTCWSWFLLFFVSGYLSEVSQTEKDKHHIISLICGI